MTWDLNSYLAQRLRAIQSRHNFNPDIGSEQMRPESAQAYGAFREILGIIERGGLDVAVGYDPAGLTPLERAEVRAVRVNYVYFYQIVEDPKTWKVGFSWVPQRRKQALQVGNPKTLSERYRVEAGDIAAARELEKRVKIYFSHYGLKGEWRNLEPDQVHACVQRLLAGERDFLRTPLPKNG